MNRVDSRASCWFEVVLLGSSGVGKTALLNRLIDDSSPIVLEPTATAGAEYRTKTISLSNATIRLKIWDFAGQER
ncbi:hypothetical protein KR222_006510 [Zaprionus bogoriensis]|nr:hypothetical protein KR222_006510 [Zaprionus bogoriensis]